MNNGTLKLEHDLTLVEAMNELLADYLSDDALFQPLPNPDYPYLTLGVYWMLEERLSALSYLLSPQQRTQLQQIQHDFQAISAVDLHRIWLKAGEELQVRLRQWRVFLGEFLRDANSARTYYAHDVQVRVILKILIDQLEMAPDAFDPAAPQAAAEYDAMLREIWVPGSFLWPREWQPAYPENLYWWLYGLPGQRP